MGANVAEEARNVYHCDFFRAFTGDEDAGLVGSDGNAKGTDGVALEFVKGQLDGCANIGAEEGERVGEGTCMFDVCEWDEVAGVQVGGYSESAVGRESDVETVSDAGERDAIADDSAGGVNDGDFGVGRGAMGSGIGVDVRDVELAAVR